jgi:hypothetical protein
MPEARARVGVGLLRGALGALAVATAFAGARARGPRALAEGIPVEARRLGVFESLSLPARPAGAGG